MSGFFGIGIEHGKTEANIGTLWRSANIFGASFIFTIGKRYQKQTSDTLKTHRSIPLYHYETFSEFYRSLPYDCRLIGVETDENAETLPTFRHPKRCAYLLGAEDHGLSRAASVACHQFIRIPTPKDFCLNVAVAGSIVLYSRSTLYRTNT